MSKIINKTIILLAITSLIFLSPAPAYAEEANYYYKRTKRIVSMLHEAVKELENKGETAFPAFAERSSRWFQDEMYLFIYTMKGVNIFHPVQEELVGKNLYDMKDANGRPLIRLLIEKAQAGGGWVHYMWTRPGEFIPTWKSGYVKKAIMPDGREVIIGTGIYNIRTEKQFIIDMVDDAIALIEKKEESAFKLFRSDENPLYFRNSYIFVFKENGTSVVDPGFPYLEGRNLLKYDVIKTMINRIKGKNAAWVSYLRPKPGDVNPSKKLAYLRTITVKDEKYIVGADFFPPRPIWMK